MSWRVSERTHWISTRSLSRAFAPLPRLSTVVQPLSASLSLHPSRPRASPFSLFTRKEHHIIDCPMLLPTMRAHRRGRTTRMCNRVTAFQQALTRRQSPYLSTIHRCVSYTILPRFAMAPSWTSLLLFLQYARAALNVARQQQCQSSLTKRAHTRSTFERLIQRCALRWFTDSRARSHVKRCRSNVSLGDPRRHMRDRSIDL